MAQANGASISLVRDALLNLANKDQQGFVSDSEFNTFAQVAQLNIYNRLFDEIKDAKRLSRAGFNPTRDKSRIKRIEEDLSYFSKKLVVPKSDALFNKPSDLSRIISISTKGNIMLDQSSKKPIEVCYDEEKIERILLSNLSSPSEDFPVALVSDDIYIFPTSIKNIEVRYYKIPQGRLSTGERSGSQPTYFNGTASDVDFELPEHYTSDLIYEIARMVGINLRDADVSNYASQEIAANKQAETY